jgi:DNA-binding SARP family transcriptional activator
VTYRVLGQLVIEKDGAELTLPTGHRLTVLGALLLHANRRVSTAELLRAGWGSSDVDETQLHKCVSYLRKMLDELGRRDHLVTHQRYGYELKVAETDLDKLVFERLVRDADPALQLPVEEEVGLLRQALQLWRGARPLAGVPGEIFRREAADLEQRRKRAAVRLFELELQQGRYERILDELHTIVGYHPTDRRLCELLMVALYRSGHATEALAAYERYTLALQEDTGGEPEPLLRNLNYAIASADEHTIARYEDGAGLQVRSQTLPTVVPRQLPPAPADFLGRVDFVAEARWLLSREPGTAAPIVVVTGQGGIGKTALAIHVAHLVRARYPDGQLYVELRGTTANPVDTGEVLAQVLRAFGVERVPVSRGERVALYRSLLGDRRVLLVLDDARDEVQIRDLIPGGPACGVLITTRHRLPDIDGAHHVPTLAPLAPAEATELFQRVLRRGGLNANAEASATRRVVEFCAGLPLALCIAGAVRARDQDSTTADLAQRLAHQRLGTVVYGERSVDRSIGAGFDQLDQDAQRLFLGLGLLATTDFGLWQAAALLAGTHADPAATLLKLAGSHMLQSAGPGMRYQFHDLTRAYAAGLAESRYPPDERKAIVTRVYVGLLTLVRHAHRKLYGGDYEVVHGDTPLWTAAPEGVLAEIGRAPMSWYENERQNIRAAVHHTAALGLADLCWDLAVSTHEFYTIRGDVDDWHDTHLVALQACRAAGNVKGEAATLAMLGQPTLVASRRPGVSGPAELRRAAQLFARAGDRHGEAIALRTLANSLRRKGQLHRALDVFTEALGHYTHIGDRVGTWQAMRYIGQTYLDLNQPRKAFTVMADAQALADGTGNVRLVAQSAYWSGYARLGLGDPRRAREDFQLVLTTVGDSDDTGRAYALHGLGDTARQTGVLPEAAEFLDAAVDLARQAGDAVLEGRVSISLANLHQEYGHPDEQAAALRHAAECFAGCGASYLESRVWHALADLYLTRGDSAAAQLARSNAAKAESDAEAS